MKRLVWITALVAGVSLTIAAGIAWIGGSFGGFGRQAGAETKVLDERESFPLEGLERLIVRTSSEDIRLRFASDGEGTEVHVRFHGTVRGSNPQALPQLKVERGGGEAEVRVERERALVFDWFSGDLVLEVAIPAGYEGALRVRSASGDLDLLGAADSGSGIDELEASTSSGDLRLAKTLAGQATLRSSSGDLSIEGLQTRRVDFSSSSGKIEARGLAGDVRAHSASGDIILALAAPPGDVEVSTSSGQVSLTFPPASGFRLTARSSSGRVRSGLPITLDAEDGGGRRNALDGIVGDGRGTVNVRTASGDIRVESR